MIIITLDQSQPKGTTYFVRSVLNLDLFVSTVRENKGMGLLPDSEERLQHAVSDTHHDTPPTLDADCGSLDPPAATLKEFFGLYLMLR